MESPEWEISHLRKLSASLDSLRQAAILTDITLVCGKREFPAHRFILCAVSNFFQSACSLEWSDSQACKVELPTVNPESMETILAFIYTGKVGDIKKDNGAMQGVLEASNYLQIEDLVQVAFRVLTQLRLSPTNFREIYDIAEKIGNPNYISQIEVYISRNFKQVATSNDFLLLSFDQLKKIFNHPELNPNHMDGAIMSVLRWVEFDKSRYEFFKDLIENLDLAFVSKDRLSHLLQRNATVKSDPEVVKMLSSTISSRSFANSPLCTPQKSKEHSFSIDKNEEPQNLVFFGEMSERQVLKIYHVENNEWLPPKDLPFRLSPCMAAAGYRNCIYFFGGRDAASDLPVTTVIKYCYRTNSSSSSVGSIISPVYQAGAGVLNDYIYIVNGLGKEKFVVKTVQRYNPRDGTCRTLAFTREGHNKPYVFSFNNYLYVVGSDNDEDYRYNVEMCVERYDPTRRQWTIITRVPGSADWCSAALCGTKLLVVRNVQETLFEVYDFRTEEWHVREFLWDEGPDRVDGLWSARRRGKHVLFVEHNGILNSYDVESAEWDKNTETSSDTWHIFQSCTM